MKAAVRFILLALAVLMTAAITFSFVIETGNLVVQLVRIIGGVRVPVNNIELSFIHSALLNNAMLFLSIASFHIIFTISAIMMIGIRVSNTWREIFFFAVIGYIALVIVSLIAGFIIQVAAGLIVEGIFTIRDWDSVIGLLILGAVTAYVTFIDWIVLNAAWGRIWYVFSGIWRLEARIDFIRSLPRSLRPQSFLRSARRWAGGTQNNRSRSSRTVTLKEISGLNDPITGSSLDPEKGLSRCSQCGTFYHSNTLPDLQSLNNGQCVNCSNTSINPISIAAQI